VKAYIISRIGTDTSVLRQVLAELSVFSEDAFDFHPESTIAIGLQQRVLAADFAIAALDKSPDPQVGYEVGLCDALKRPILVIAPANLDLPQFLRRFILVRAKISSKRLLEVALRDFVESLQESQNNWTSLLPTEPPHPSRVGAKHLVTLANQLEAKRANLGGKEAETAVVKLFKELGLTTVAQSGPNRVDMAVWATALDPTLGNQILVEVKAGALNTRALDSAETALRAALGRARAYVGLLLYLDRSGKRFARKPPTDRLVLRFDLVDFVQRCSEESFEQILLTERNRLVHGGF
jgi:hypothetical protein